jgi:signal transduction histidine kinase
MLRKIPLGLKASLGMGALLLVAAVAQALLIRWAVHEEREYLLAHGIQVQRVRPFVILAVGAPLFVASIGTGVIATAIARRRTRALVEALRKVAQGELRTQLPPAPDRDFVVVQDAFHAMGAALDDLTRKLSHADAQRRRLFADLAHELATPTSTILGISEALARPEMSGDPEVRAKLVNSLELESTRLERLIRDVRELATLDDPDVRLVPEEADLAPIARRVAERFLPGEHAKIVCETEEARVEVDVLRFEQVLVNLLTNALRYTPREGTVRVTVSKDARVVVEDSGAGVPEELLARLGERLLRIDPSRDRMTGGHGLGLSIVSAIVHRHGGKLRFERSELGGLRVVIQLGSG